jgi:hypothetical protein
MAIGDTVQAGLMRTDSSPILLAGQAQAKANQAFGDALNTAAQGYFQGQEKKKKLESTKEGLRSLFPDAPDGLINSMAKNPEVAQTKMALEKLAIERKSIASAAASAGAERAQQAAFQQDKLNERNRILKEAEEAKQITREANQFLRTRPQAETPEFSNLLEEFSPDQIPGTPEFEAKELSEPMGARPPLMASIATDKPNFEMFNVGKAPIEQQLPESFQGQAGRIIDMADNGEISQPAADLALNRIQQQAMAEQKAGPKPMTPMEEAELKKLNLANRKAEFELSDLETPKTDYKAGPTIVEDNIFRALDIIKESPRTTTGMGSYLSNIPGTDAKSLKERLASIKANIGFDYLQAMREASPTGGALGNVSDKELQGLQSVFGSLEQSLDDAELTYNLNLLNYTYNNVIHGEGNHNVLHPRKGGSSPQQSANTIDPADLENAIQAKRKQLEQRTMMQQTLDNPNVPNYGPQ